MTNFTSDQIHQWLAEVPAGAALYLVGAGGCGMSGLAHLLLDLGFQVAGSDLVESGEVAQLRARGATIHLGHRADHLRAIRPACVIHSSAIPADNEELVAAQAGKIPVIRRGALLAALHQRQTGICVAGMHGKTTTASLLTFALARLQALCSYAIGARVPQLERHARFIPAPADGKQPFFVVETDESDGTLCEFRPEHAIVLNIDEEHLDYYGGMERVEAEFERFGARTRSKLFYCADDLRLAETFSQRTGAITFGFHPSAHYQVRAAQKFEADPSCWTFEIWHDQRRLAEFCLGIPGEKNASNAAGVIALLHQLGFEPLEIASAISSFRGAERRQQQLFSCGRVRIYDDYAHHPNEIRATLQALRQKEGRLLVAFQPHRFSRTRQLIEEFASCFAGADQVWITEIYAASEKPIDGISGRALAERVAQTGQRVQFVPELEALPGLIRSTLAPGDLVLFLGAGSITQAAHALAADLERQSVHVRTLLFSELKTLLSPDTTVRQDELLSRRTTLRVGGKADFYVEPVCEEELAAVLRFCSDHGLPHMILGRGSNLLVLDGGVRGVVINLGHASFSRIEGRGRELHCGAGARLKQVALEARRNGLGRLEFLEGIPGSVGGALRMNAGAMGHAMFSVVKSIRCMDPQGHIQERAAAEFQVTYRNCPMLKTHIALGAVLEGEPAPAGEIVEKMNTCNRKRWDSQPAAPSAGCIFKNPLTVPAGKLIDELGLKGTRVGGAMISPLHGNFIVNEGNATAQDVLRLIEIVQERARTVRGIQLETEVQIVGDRSLMTSPMP